MLNGEFKGDRRELGRRLEQIRGLGRRGGLRFVEEAEPAKEVAPLPNSPDGLSKAPDEGARRSGPRGGRPRLIEGRPWEAAGVSRRTWERRKKGGGG